jgi:hypothetical protein
MPLNSRHLPRTWFSCVESPGGNRKWGRDPFAFGYLGNVVGNEYLRYGNEARRPQALLSFILTMALTSVRYDGEVVITT